MINLKKEYILSLYKSLHILKETNKSTIEIVQHKNTDKIYIKKTLNNYNINVFNKLKDMNCINLPKIFEIFEYENKLIIIEEYISGNSLHDIIEENGKLSKETSINYILTICDALYKLHSQNPPIIHRDIKPSNIIITHDNILKIIDFDASRIYNEFETEDTFLLGTEGYAAPEAYGFSQTDCRSDIYSIGVLLNIMITAQFPKKNIPNSKLGEIIKKCTNISPNDRYSSLLDLKNDLLCLKETKETILSSNKSLNSLRFALPGFRSEILIFNISASMWYIIILFGFFQGIFSHKTLLNDDIIISLSLIFLTLFYGNYLNMQKKFPLLKNRKKSKYIVGMIFYSAIFILILSELNNIISTK